MTSRSRSNLTVNRRATYSASIENLPKAIAFVLSCSGECGFSGKRMTDIHLVVEEAVVNIVNYAYGDAKGDFEIECSCPHAGSLIIEISDKGTPFNIFSLPEPDMNADIAERRIGGLGIHLIKNLTDKVDYRYEDNKNILTLTISKKYSE